MNPDLKQTIDSRKIIARIVDGSKFYYLFFNNLCNKKKLKKDFKNSKKTTDKL